MEKTRVQKLVALAKAVIARKNQRSPADKSKPWYQPQIKREYKLGYPYASEAELQQLMDAEEKLGHPPKSLKEAQAELAAMVKPTS